jgi:L-ascorbate metabolism protein UlaG (beta-lactamase superfamily)
MKQHHVVPSRSWTRAALAAAGVVAATSCGGGPQAGGGMAAASAAGAPGSELVITPFVGASVQIEYRGTVIHVDPWGRGDYSDAKPADLILVTDTPGDHLDPDLIATLRRPGTPVVLSDRPEEARDEGSRERLLRVPDATVMDNGDRLTLAGVGIEAVPMYDIIPGEPFHSPGEGNGYILTLGDTRVYLAGVTECTPEMQQIRDIDIAFIPMNLPHGRMPPTAAADCVKLIRPSVVYPYHYREQPIDVFVNELAGEADIEVRVHDWYPPAA